MFEAIDPAHLSTVAGGISEAAALANVIRVESGGNTHAKNPHSTAFGIGQLLIGNRIHYLGRANANTTDRGLQMQAMNHYIKDRYGDARNAWSHEQRFHWY